MEPKIQIESFSQENILNLTFTKPVLLIPNPVININKEVLEIYIESDFDVFEYFGMVVDWKAHEMTKDYILIELLLQN